MLGVDGGDALVDAAGLPLGVVVVVRVELPDPVLLELVVREGVPDGVTLDEALLLDVPLGDAPRLSECDGVVEGVALMLALMLALGDGGAYEYDSTYGPDVPL